MVIQPDDDERPHLDALSNAVAEGFVRLTPADELIMLLERARNGVVETITIENMGSARSQRWRLSEQNPGSAVSLWRCDGTVAEVIGALIALPEDGTPGAPAVRAEPSDPLWLPGDLV